MTTIWIDAQLSPTIATWIDSTFEDISAFALRDLGLRDAEDLEIFEAAKAQEVIFLTKDSDFIDLVERKNAPPKIIWLTCGNTSNALTFHGIFRGEVGCVTSSANPIPKCVIE